MLWKPMNMLGIKSFLSFWKEEKTFSTKNKEKRISLCFVAYSHIKLTDNDASQTQGKLCVNFTWSVDIKQRGNGNGGKDVLLLVEADPTTSAWRVRFSTIEVPRSTSSYMYVHVFEYLCMCARRSLGSVSQCHSRQWWRVWNILSTGEEDEVILW